jgi:hypothetical protein
MLLFIPRSLCALKRVAAKAEHARFGATQGMVCKVREDLAARNTQLRTTIHVSPRVAPGIGPGCGPFAKGTFLLCNSLAMCWIAFSALARCCCELDLATTS